MMMAPSRCREVQQDFLASSTKILLTAVENGGAGRSKMRTLGGVDLP
jgi:hypothetical protein